jgi:hypothetical protein
MNTAIEAAATSGATATTNSTGTGFATANMTPPPPPASEPITSTDSFDDGGKFSDNEKLQWVAIVIFAISIIAVSYKAIYYKKAIDLLGTDNKKTTNKLKELENNIRALRGDKYEPAT